MTTDPSRIETRIITPDGAPQIRGVVVAATTVDPAARCPAATGRPGHQAAACRVHGDGAHRCYRSPTHQIDAHNDDGRARALPEGLTYADHVCDCDFAWSSAPTVTVRRAALDGPEP